MGKLMLSIGTGVVFLYLLILTGSSFLFDTPGYATRACFILGTWDVDPGCKGAKYVDENTDETSEAIIQAAYLDDVEDARDAVESRNTVNDRRIKIPVVPDPPKPAPIEEPTYPKKQPEKPQIVIIKPIQAAVVEDGGDGCPLHMHWVYSKGGIPLICEDDN